MRREIYQFIQRNGGRRHADGVGQLLLRWQRATRQVAKWRQLQMSLGELVPDCVDDVGDLTTGVVPALSGLASDHGAGRSIRPGATHPQNEEKVEARCARCGASLRVASP
jgi:hypothetical protein